MVLVWQTYLLTKHHIAWSFPSCGKFHYVTPITSWLNTQNIIIFSSVFFFFALKQSATLLSPDSKRFAIQIIYAAFHWVPLCVQTSFTYVTVKNLSWTSTSKKRPWSQDGNSSFCYTKTTIIIIEFFVTQNITVTVLEIFSSGIFRTFLKKNLQPPQILPSSTSLKIFI